MFYLVMTNDNELMREYLKTVIAGLVGGVVIFLGSLASSQIESTNYNPLAIFALSITFFVLSLVTIYVFWFIYKVIHKKNNKTLKKVL